jgi:RNA polymerase sigma-B factor
MIGKLTRNDSRGAQERAKAVQDAVELLSRAYGKPPTVQQLAVYLELSEEEILDGLQVAHAYTASSLDAPLQNGEDDETTLASTPGEHDNGLEYAETRMLLEDALAGVSDREQRLVRLPDSSRGSVWLPRLSGRVDHGSLP